MDYDYTDPATEAGQWKPTNPYHEEERYDDEILNELLGL